MKGINDFSQKIPEFEKYYKGRWVLWARDPQVWYQYAESLKTATIVLRNSLWPKDRKRFNTKAAAADLLYGPVYMLLAGHSIETLLKGIIIANHPELVEQQRLSKELTHHRLSELYKKAGLKENNRYNELLLRLQNYIEIFGRYPVTKEKKDMGKLTKTRFAGLTDPSRIDELWKYLFSHRLQTKTNIIVK